MPDTEQPETGSPPTTLELLHAAARAAMHDISKRDEVIQREEAARDRDVQLFEQLAELIRQHGGEAPAALRGPDMVYRTADGLGAIIEVKPHGGGAEAPTNTREAVLYLLRGVNRPMETSEIVEGVQRMDGVESQAATTRSLLSKMADSGQLTKVRRGLYRLNLSYVSGHPRGTTWVRGHYREPGDGSLERWDQYQPTVQGSLLGEDDEDRPTGPDGMAHSEDESNRGTTDPTANDTPQAINQEESLS